MCFDFLHNFVSNISYSKKRLARHGHKCVLIFMLFLSDFNDNFSTDFLKILQYKNLTKIRPMGAELSHAEGQTES